MGAHKKDMASLPPPGTKTKAKKWPKKPGAGDEAKEKLDPGANPAVTHKTKLNSFVMSVVKRPLQKGETLYQTVAVSGGHQATVTIKALPGDWTSRSWAGRVFPTKQQAEQSAAEIALASITADEGLQEIVKQPKPKTDSPEKQEK